MRYYTIRITDPDTGILIREYTSLAKNGDTIRGALTVELDVPVVLFATPMGAAYIRVWGISLQDISQASDLNRKRIQLFAGMQKGLPLANPAQSGLLLDGVVQQAFGNWQDITQTLDLIVQADGGTAAQPKNIVLPWRANMPLSTAVDLALATAFPTYTRNVNISPNLVLNHDEIGYFQSLTQFAQYLKAVSQNIIGGSYQGVAIVLKETAFNVYDGTSITAPLDILFVDLIGQPTWIDAGTIQFKTAMRADLTVGDYVRLPPGQITTTAQSYSQYRDGSIFQGTYQIKQIRHVGNFRQADASAWVTVFDAYLAA